MSVIATASSRRKLAKALHAGNRPSQIHMLISGSSNAVRRSLLAVFAVLILFAAKPDAWSQACPASPSYTPDFSANQNCIDSNGIQVDTPSTAYPGFYPVVPAPPTPPPGVSTVLRITPNLTVWAGSSWYNIPQPVAGGFSTTFTFQLSGGNTDLSPADGFAFVIQNSPATTSALGPEGCGQGFGWSNFCLNLSGPQVGIPNSLAVEFNTFYNPNADPNNNDVAIQNCSGSGANSVDPTCTLAVNSNLQTTLADGNVHSVTITYSGATTTLLDVVLDGNDLFPATAAKPYDGVLFDLTTIQLTGGNAWVGFTAGTGGGDDNQDILSWTFAPTQQGQQISSSNSSSLTQSFVISNVAGQYDEFDFDFSVSNGAGDLTIQPGTTPFLTPSGITPFDWATIVNGTSMADAPCLIAAGQTFCAVNTLTCTTSANSIAAGANCPQSTNRNVLFTQQIDVLQNQPGITNGILTVPQGYAPGLAMAPDMLVSGAECNFPSNGLLANSLCPQSILTQFDDGTARVGGTGTTTNSTYVIFCCAPEWQTTPTIALWNNSTSVSAVFNSVPPPTPNPNTNNFVASQGASVVVGAEPHGTVLDTTYPLPGEQTLNNPIPCPALGLPPATPWSTQNAQPFSVNGLINTYDNNGTATLLKEGAYDAHYFSVDCDNFEELVFPATLDLTPGTPGPNVATFKTVPFNIDTTVPAVTSVVLNPPGGFYAQNSPLTATVTCSDPSSATVANFFSGIAHCGAQGSPQPFAGNPQTVSTSAIPLSTATLGTQTFTAVATDVAGNSASPVPIQYQVVGSADLGVAMIANLTEKTGTNLTYYIAVGNAGPNTAESVELTDAIPSGTTFVSSGFAIESCTFSGGQPSCSITAPKNSCGNIPGSCNIGPLAAWTAKNPTGALVQITVKVNAAANTILNNVAVVSEANYDPNSNNNMAKWATLVTK